YSEAVNTAVLKANLTPFKNQIKISVNLKVLSRFEHFLSKNQIHFKKEFKENEVWLLVDLEPAKKEEFENFAREFNALFF
ncbi:MAG: YigZ family protein, partial [Campylobacter sp.]|nr:YigZ family protein [Campylobacter sp.]